MKRFSITLLLLALMLLSACGCKHTFSAATCTEPETCTACGETNGEALGTTGSPPPAQRPNAAAAAAQNRAKRWDTPRESGL